MLGMVTYYMDNLCSPPFMNLNYKDESSPFPFIYVIQLSVLFIIRGTKQKSNIYYLYFGMGIWAAFSDIILESGHLSFSGES